jgi:hypothetical protein
VFYGGHCSFGQKNPYHVRRVAPRVRVLFEWVDFEKAPYIKSDDSGLSYRAYLPIAITASLI